MKFHAINEKFNLVNAKGERLAVLQVVETGHEPYSNEYPDTMVRKNGCAGCYFNKRRWMADGRTTRDCSLKDECKHNCWYEEREDGKTIKYIRIK